MKIKHGSKQSNWLSNINDWNLLLDVIQVSQIVRRGDTILKGCFNVDFTHKTTLIVHFTNRSSKKVKEADNPRSASKKKLENTA